MPVLRTHRNSAALVFLALLCVSAAILASASPVHAHHGPDAAACVLCHSAGQPALVPDSNFNTARLCPVAFPMAAPELGTFSAPAVRKTNPRAPPA